MTVPVAEMIAAAEEAIVTGSSTGRDQLSEQLSDGFADWAGTQDRAKLAVLLDALDLPTEASRCLRAGTQHDQLGAGAVLLNT